MGKTVDISRPDTLSSDKIDKLLEKPLEGPEDERLQEQNTPPAEPETGTPEKPGEQKPKPEEQPKPAEKPGEKPGEQKPGEAAPAPSPKSDKQQPPAPAQPGEKLYAGKYRTTEELKKGFLEAAKPLKYDQKFLEKVLAIAEKTGDWSQVEDLYKDLDRLISENRKAASPSPESPETDPTKATPPSDTDRIEREFAARYIVSELLTELAQSDIAQRLAKRGVQIPENFMVDRKASEEFMERLEDEFPAEAVRLEQFLIQTSRQLSQEAADVMKAHRESQTHNQAERDGALAAIKEFAKKYNYELKDEDLAAFLEEAARNGQLYEERHGVSYLRKGALLEAWKQANMERLIEHIRLTSETRGREQAAEDLKSLKSKGLDSISTKKLGSERADKPIVDVTDPEQRANLTDAQIEEMLKSGAPKPR